MGKTTRLHMWAGLWAKPGRPPRILASNVIRSNIVSLLLNDLDLDLLALRHPEIFIQFDGLAVYFAMERPGHAAFSDS